MPLCPEVCPELAFTANTASSLLEYVGPALQIQSQKYLDINWAILRSQHSLIYLSFLNKLSSLSERKTAPQDNDPTNGFHVRMGCSVIFRPH